MSTKVTYQVSASLPSGISSARRVRAGIEVGRNEPYVGPLTDKQRKAIEADPYLTIAPVQDGEENTEAAEAVATAQAEATKIVDQAKAEAADIVSKADEVVKAAEKTIADAKSKGEEIVQAAKDLAKDITEKAKEDAKAVEEAAKTATQK